MKRYTVRVFSKTNPSVEVISETDHLKDRIQKLTENIRASKGLIDHSQFDRFNKFRDIPMSDIDFEVVDNSAQMAV
jgi:hypothetical protein